MSVHIQNQRVPIVWLWAERWFGDSPCKIRFSADRSKLGEPPKGYAMATTFASLNFRHVLSLLNHINIGYSGAYSWWWASTNMGMLHGGFGGSWVKPPSPGWLESSLKLFSRRTYSIESLQQRFAVQFPNAKKISLKDPETWKNSPLLSPTQPI
jgi:hypothetical protein